MTQKSDSIITTCKSKNAFECYQRHPVQENKKGDILQEIADENIYYMRQIAATDLPEKAKQALQTVRSFLFAMITECLPVMAKSSADSRRIISVENAYSILLNAKQELEGNICKSKKNKNENN